MATFGGGGKGNKLHVRNDQSKTMRNLNGGGGVSFCCDLGVDHDVDLDLSRDLGVDHHHGYLRDLSRDLVVS